MPRSRATELPQRPSPRAPTSLRTSSSDSDPTHHRSRTERSPKLTDGRSPRGAQSDPVNQKKLGSRIADLESQLGQAQDELKCLKDQLASAEAAKKAAQEQLEKKSRKPKKVPNAVEIQEKRSTFVESRGLKKKNSCDEYETSDDTQKETDVFEVPVEKVTVESSTEVNSPADQDELKPKSVCLPTESPAMTVTEKTSFDELAMKNGEINSLRGKLDERDQELEVVRRENADIKRQLHEKSLKISSAESEIEELTLKFNKVNQELEKSKISAVQTNEKLEAIEKAKEELENEMKRLRIQTEQWRKAADAAATVLAGEVEMNERRISERCGSMEKHYGNAFEPAAGYAGFVGSPGLMDDSDDVFGGGKRKGSGIRMFGDLWRKKGHK